MSGLLTPALWREAVFDHLTFLILLFFVQLLGIVVFLLLLIVLAPCPYFLV